jgi:hypothetical protein
MECRSSGKSIAAWCEENGINIKTYYFWQKRVWDKETQTLIPAGQNQLPKPQAVQFAQVNLGTDSSSDADIVIRKDDWTVEIRNTANPALLSAVLQAVTRGV